MSSLVLPSAIHRVKLYHQGARVFRTLSAKLPESEQDATRPTMTIEVTGLPLSMQDSSIKLLLTSQRNEWAVSDIKVGLHVDRRTDLPEPPAEVALREVELELARLRSKKKLLEEEQQLIASMEPPLRPEGEDHAPPPKSPLRARLAMEGFVNASIEERIAQGRSLQEKIDSLVETLRDLNDQVKRASSARTVQGNEVTKTVIAQLTRRRGESTSVDLELSYMTPGAKWAPQYTCRIERTGASANIQMRALVIQTSGEDWKNVKLELSTADPMSWTELPKLNSLRIGKAQPTPAVKPGFRPAPKGAEQLFQDYDSSHQRANILAPTPSPTAFKSLPSRELQEQISRHLFTRIEPPVLERSHQAPPRPQAPGAVGGAPPPPSPAPAAPRKRSKAAPMTVARSASYGSQAFGDEEAPMKESAYRSEYMAEEADDVFAELDAMVADMDEPYAGLQDQKKRRDSRKPSTPSFQDLRLGSYHAARSDIARGKLRASTREERYMAIFARSELVANFRVDQIITQAEQVAMMAAHQSMPHGTTDVRSAAGYFDHVYTTHDTVDVPSDHTYHSVPVSAMEAACELRYVTVPREAQHVFREAELSNPHRAPMLSGPAEIYVGDEYVLTTTLPTVAPMGKFRLGLGVEQAIKCARNTSYREERSGRAVVATAELHHEIRIELVNNLERAITCDVRERIPQPAPDAEVVIEELEVSPAWQEYDQSERHHVLHGGRIWHLEIEPGEHVELLAHYVVKIYANNEITGGNRRES